MQLTALPRAPEERSIVWSAGQRRSQREPAPLAATTGLEAPADEGGAVQGAGFGAQTQLERPLLVALILTVFLFLVRMRGLEPPHPCEY